MFSFFFFSKNQKKKKKIIFFFLKIGSLLHFIDYNESMKENQLFVLTVIGYDKVQLRKFKEQHPAVILVNYETRTLSIVPCPLDFATMGDNVKKNSLNLTKKKKKIF